MAGKGERECEGEGDREVRGAGRETCVDGGIEDV